jgi:Putative adhesin
MRIRLAQLTALAVVVLLASGMAAASEQGHFQKTLQVSGATDLQVFTHSGDITIRPGPAGTISITGRIHVGDAWLMSFGHDRKQEVTDIENNPPIQQSGNNVRIDYVNHRNISVDYEITAPTDTKIHTRSGSGDQTIEGMKSGIDVETGSGDVKLNDLAGDIRIHTGSGNVQARGAAGPLEARAGSGDITIEEKSKGDVRVETGSGNIEARGVDGGFNASTGSGDVRVDGTPANSWYVKTGSGNAELRLPQQAAFDLDVSTSSGSVEVNHPVNTTVQGRVQESRKSIRGKVNGGGPEINVHTGSGDVRVD